MLDLSCAVFDYHNGSINIEINKTVILLTTVFGNIHVSHTNQTKFEMKFRNAGRN